MQTNEILVRELRKLLGSYRDGSVGLPTLASRSESLIEQLKSVISENDFACAMNAVYLFEEINALALDEKRKLVKAENDAIEAELALLERLVLRM